MARTPKIPMSFAPAVTTVFVFGVLWKRGTWQAAVLTLYVGSILGVIYFLVDLPSIGKLILGSNASNPNFAGLVTDPLHGLGIPFMLVGPILGAACILIYIITSFLTPPMNQERIAKVCWDHPFAFLRGSFTGVDDVRFVTLILVTVMCVLYYLFR